MTQARTRARTRAFAAALIALALAVRLMVPAGWMPDEKGGFAITLCPGNGPAVTAWMDAEGKLHESKPHTKGAPESPCAFAGIGAPMLAGEVPVPVLAPVALEASAPVAPRLIAAPGRGLAAPPPPATGPPLTA